MPNDITTFVAPSAVEKLFNRLFGFFVGIGLGLSYNYLLQVRGRTTGRVYSTPVNVLNLEGKRYIAAEILNEILKTPQRRRNHTSKGLVEEQTRTILIREKPGILWPSSGSSTRLCRVLFRRTSSGNAAFSYGFLSNNSAFADSRHELLSSTAP